ncbi:MAG: DinB family protein [Treponema sp.]|jgi:uncharacterized damage-inducible protein DinB|nr:DinB family protein [Treponema sp.]
MGKYNFELMTKYNKDVNKQLNEIIQTLSEEQWDKQFPSFWKSIHELCSHIFAADYRWLNRFKLIVNSQILTDIYFNKAYGFEELFFKSINEYITKRIEMDNIIIDFVKDLTENDLDKILKYPNPKGILFENRIDVCLMHLFNHQTHHRGMISLYLEMLGKENDFSNLYLNE